MAIAFLTVVTLVVLVVVLHSSRGTPATLGAAASAHADPSLTSKDQTFESVLTHAPSGLGSESRGQARGIYPGPGLTDSDIVSLGHRVVADVRAGKQLDLEATSLWESGKLGSIAHAQYFAVAAIVVYAPELRHQIGPSEPWQGYYYEIWRMVYGGTAPSEY